MNRRRVRIRLAAAVATAAALLPAASAQAGLLAQAAVNCDDQQLAQVFMPWADIANYTLAPGGAAETGAGWTASGDAAIVPGNEPWNVHAPEDAASLQLGAGSTATTDPICVGIEHPTLRFFARSQSTGLLSSLRVDVLFVGPLGLELSLPIGAVLPTLGQWTPTLPYVVVANLLPLLPGERTPVAFRFTPMGSGTWQIDDVYVDPYGRR